MFLFEVIFGFNETIFENDNMKSLDKKESMYKLHTLQKFK